MPYMHTDCTEIAISQDNNLVNYFKDGLYCAPLFFRQQIKVNRKTWYCNEEFMKRKRLVHKVTDWNVTVPQRILFETTVSKEGLVSGYLQQAELNSFRASV